MAKVEITTCDGCGKPASERYSFISPDPGWCHIHNHSTEYGRESFDACSPECVMTVARLIAGIMADPLEELFTAPAAVKPAPKPRKPRA